MLTYIVMTLGISQFIVGSIFLYLSLSNREDEGFKRLLAMAVILLVGGVLGTYWGISYLPEGLSL